MSTDKEAGNSKTVAENTAKTKKSKEEIAEILKNINDEYNNSLDRLQEQLRILEKQKTQLEDLNIIQGTTHGALESEIALQKAKIDLKQKEVDLENDIKNLKREGIDVTIENGQYIFQQTEAISTYTSEQRAALDALNQQKQELQELRDLEEERRDYAKEYRDAQGGADSLMAKLGKKSVFFSTNINKMAESWAKFSTPAGRDALLKSMKQQFNLSNFLVSSTLAIIEVTAKLVIAADKATTSLAKATGTGREFNDVLVGAQKTGNLFGLSMDESSKSIQGLLSNTTNYVNLSKQQQTSITTQVGLLSKLGVSADDAADMIQTMNLTMGMTMEQATETTKAIAMMGVQLGISSKKMAQDFKNAMGTLAVYGPQATTVFKNLAANAKAAGVEMGSLLKLAKKFDTFKDAATTVAKFNALLGTQLSTTQMLMQTEDERIETIIKSVQAQGVAFKDMDRFQQKAVAAAAGIDDLNEANKIFGMNLSQFREYKNEMDENEVAQQKFNEAIDATIPIATKLIVIFQELAVIVMPILEGLHWALDGIRGLIMKLPEGFKSFLKTAVMIGAVAVALYKFWGVIVSIGAVLLKVGAAIGAIAGAVTPVGWAVIGVSAALAGLFAIFSKGEKKSRKLRTSLYDLDNAAVGAGATRAFAPRQQDNSLRTNRARAEMTQNTVSYSRETQSVTNVVNNQSGIDGQRLNLVLEDGTEMRTYIAKQNLR